MRTPGQIDRDPTDAVRAPRPARFQAPTIGADDARLILATFYGDAVEPAIALALGGGLRRSEILGVRWARVDLEGGFLRVEETLQPIRGRSEVEFCLRKSSSPRRTIALPAWCMEILRRHRVEQAARRLALGERGLASISSSNEATVVHCIRASSLAAFGPGFSLLARRPRGMASRRRGWSGCTICGMRTRRCCSPAVSPLKAISERLGHSTIGITADIYAHVLAELDRDAAARLDVMFGASPGG